MFPSCYEERISVSLLSILNLGNTFANFDTFLHFLKKWVLLHGLHACYENHKNLENVVWFLSLKLCCMEI